ncbi:ATP-grasp fold amidoligase family protein [Photobacterium leiognathi]|uniref:ATP-grasp fold amidoligase family protein n=1 Tax=Photobacterium leiognathi TaxID=553611 RepID=UPI002981E579|nr:ATP-grasp fold amidoligase family protein [Photobacterium leiognathi]
MFDKLLKVIPKSLLIRIYFLYKHHTFLSIKNPKKFSELIQRRKFNLIKEYSSLSDKYVVRSYVSDKIGKNYLIPLIGVYNNVNEIDYNLLPSSFVMKTNFGSGNSHIEIVKDKKNIDYEKLKKKFSLALDLSYRGSLLGENHYDLIERKIIVEQFINNNGNDIEDFKFHIFNSKDGFLQIDFDRFTKHKRNLYDFNWEALPYGLLYPSGVYTLPDLELLNKMKEVAFKLSEGFDYVRVDLYLVNGQVLFGEMTFTPGSGFETFTDVKAEFKYGSMWLDM